MRKSILFVLLLGLAVLAAACAQGAAPAAPTAAPAAPKAAAPTEAPKAAAPTAAAAAPTVAAAAKATEAPKAAAPTAAAAAAAPKVETGKGGTLRYNVGTYPDNLDPHQASFTNEIIHLRMMYEGLTKLDKDLKIVPGAAESWKVSEDGKTYTFTLRPNLKFSDGSPLTAKDFEWSVKRAASPEVAGEYQAETFIIEGAEAYATADMKATSKEQLQALRDKVAVKALDDKTLEIKLVKPATHFPATATLWVLYPLKQSVIEDPKCGENWFTKAECHVGNGPFKVTTMKEKEITELAPNTNYYKPPQLEKLVFRYITDSKVAFEAYKNGELDLITLAAEDLETAMKDGTLSKEVVRYPGACTLGMLFNNAREPFNKVEARQAFAKAVDRQAYVNDVLRGIGKVTTGWIPKGIEGHQPTAGAELKYDPAAAKDLWTKAGYTGEVKLTYASTPRNKTRFEFLANQLTKNLGANVVLDPVEPTTATALQKDKATFPLVTIGGWCSDYPDPQNWISVYWTSTGFAERYSYSNPKVDALAAQADVERDPAKRVKMYQDAENLVLADTPMGPLYNSENVFLVKPFVKGYATTAQDHFPGEFNIFDVTAQK